MRRRQSGGLVASSRGSVVGPRVEEFLLRLRSMPLVFHRAVCVPVAQHIQRPCVRGPESRAGASGDLHHWLGRAAGRR